MEVKLKDSMIKNKKLIYKIWNLLLRIKKNKFLKILNYNAIIQNFEINIRIT